jgi:hypothetical protein
MNEIAVAPALVWDCNDDVTHGLACSPRVYDWVKRNTPEPGFRIHRIEFYVLDGPPSAVVYRYRQNEDGKLMRDPATGKAAEEKPEHVMLDALPPWALWPDHWKGG